MVYIVGYYTGDCCCRTWIDRVFTIEAQAKGYLSIEERKPQNKDYEYYIEEREVW